MKRVYTAIFTVLRDTGLGPVSLLAFAMMFFTLSGCVSEPDDPLGAEIAVGDICPDFSVETDDGLTVSRTSLAGSPFMIVFFNTGCGDCRRELPVVQQAAGVYPDLTIICISRQEDAQSIRGYWEENHLTLRWSAQHDDAVYRRFAASGIPRIYIVDAALKVTGVFSDYPLPSLQELLQAMGKVSP